MEKHYYLTLNSEGKEELIASEVKKPEKPDIKNCQTWKDDACDVRFTCCETEYNHKLKQFLSSPRIPIKEEEREKFRKYAITESRHILNMSIEKIFESGVLIPSELVEIRMVGGEWDSIKKVLAYFISPKEEDLDAIFKNFAKTFPPLIDFSKQMFSPKEEGEEDLWPSDEEIIKESDKRYSHHDVSSIDFDEGAKWLRDYLKQHYTLKRK